MAETWECQNFLAEIVNGYWQAGNWMDHNWTGSARCSDNTDTIYILANKMVKVQKKDILYNSGEINQFVIFKEDPVQSRQVGGINAPNEDT